MSDIAIRIAGLGKRYQIGTQESYRSLRESLVWAAQKPFSFLSGSKTQKNSQKQFIWALKDVSLEIKQGEVVGIIGRNGAGKTTLLKILSRITEPTEGSADIYGRVSSLLEVGTGFHPELTGRENIFLNGVILGMKKKDIQRKFDEIVEFAEIEKFIDTPVKRYSSGMYVRLAFSVAAHLDSEILFVDEVLAVGDASFQKKCLGRMNDISKKGRTILYVSHNMHSMEHLCSRGILLDAGTVVADGAMPEVISEYMGQGKEQKGSVSWNSPETAPGNERARLKAVRIISDEQTSGEVDISKEFHIEIEYWNLLEGSHLMVAVLLNNSSGITVLSSANLPSASVKADPWYSTQYPFGLFRTTCTIQGNMLNEDLHTLSVFINGHSVKDDIVQMRDVLVFNVKDPYVMQREYTGKWVGVVRPLLGWQTTQLVPPDI